MNLLCRLKKLAVLVVIASSLLCLSACEDLEALDYGYYKEKLYDGTEKLEIDVSGPKSTGKGILDYLNNKSSALKETSVNKLNDLADKTTGVKNKGTEKLNEFADSLGANDSLGLEDNGREKVKLNYIIDGDTLDVKTSTQDSCRVRIIGCNTPESVAKNEYLEKNNLSNSEEGKVASDFTKDYLKNTTYLWLEYDEELYDPYGRTLAYVYLNKDDSIYQSLQAILIANGQAEPMAIEPNTKYKDIFESIYNSIQ